MWIAILAAGGGLGVYGWITMSSNTTLGISTFICAGLVGLYGGHLKNRIDLEKLGALQEKELEHYPTRWNHLTGILSRRGQARFAWRCGASAKMQGDATTRKNPGLWWGKSSFGFVATLARCACIALRAAPARKTDFHPSN